MGRPFINSAVSILRNSSSFSGSVRPSQQSPVATIEMRFASRPLPEPIVGASIKCMGDGPSITHHANQHGCTLYPHTPFLFRRAEYLVRLIIGESGPEISQMDEDAVFGLLTRTADWHRELENATIETSPPRDVARDMLAYPDLHLPILDGVITTPVFSVLAELREVPPRQPRRPHDIRPTCAVRAGSVAGRG